MDSFKTYFLYVLKKIISRILNNLEKKNIIKSPIIYCNLIKILKLFFLKIQHNYSSIFFFTKFFRKLFNSIIKFLDLIIFFIPFKTLISLPSVSILIKEFFMDFFLLICQVYCIYFILFIKSFFINELAPKFLLSI